MELRHLRYFAAVAETLNFTEAARRLAISQPPLSQQIRDLEAELGTMLIARSSRRVALTPAGVAFLAKVRGILDQADRAVAEARAIGAGLAGTLDIGLTGAVLLGGLGALVAAYQRDYPGVAVRLHEMAPSEQEQALIAGRIDVSVLRNPHKSEAYVVEPAWEEAISLALPRGHRLAARRHLRLAALRDEDFVFFRRTDSHFAEHLRECCIDAGFEPRIAQEVVEAHALLALVENGFGVALLPESAGRLAPRGVVIRPIEAPSARADVSIAYRPDHGPVVAEFLAFARGYRGRFVQA